MVSQTFICKRVILLSLFATLVLTDEGKHPTLMTRALHLLARRHAEVKTMCLYTLYTIQSIYLRLSKFAVSISISLKIRSTNA